jgi:hypothetical protein
MFRINYSPPEQMPSHQRDFPRQAQAISGVEGSRLFYRHVRGDLVTRVSHRAGTEHQHRGYRWDTQEVACHGTRASRSHLARDAF